MFLQQLLAFGQEVLCGAAHCHDVNSTCPVINLNIFNKCAAMNIAELETDF
jgi:hypothetical protein